MIKGALADAGPFAFMALRFPLALLLLWPLLGWRWPRRTSVVPGLALALFLGGSYVAQVVGLRYTTPTRSAFITGLSVILVPLLYPTVTRRLPARLPVAGAVIAFLGLVLLTRPQTGGLNRGDAITLGCAVGYALYVILLEIISRKHDHEDLLVMQFLPLAVVFVPGALAEGAVHWGRGLLWGLAVTGPVLALTMYLQTRYQRFTTATRAAVIFSAEPLFAAVFSFFIVGETLTVPQWAGGALILGGILVAVPRSRRALG
jgi:drug/metabolite transporter (DMT)-like permease